MGRRSRRHLDGPGPFPVSIRHRGQRAVPRLEGLERGIPVKAAKGARALVIVAMLVTGPVPAAHAATPVSTPAPDPALGRDRRPDPVTFVPEARRPDIARHPEATIGFASRSLLEPHGPKPKTAPKVTVRPTRSPEPVSDPAAQIPVGSSTAGGAVPPGQHVIVGPAPTVEGSGSATLAAVPQVKGTIRNSSNVALSGMGVCLMNPVTQSCDAYTTTAANGSYALDASAGSWYVLTAEATYPYTSYLPGYWSATGYQYSIADAGVVVVGATDVTGKNINVPPIPRIRGTVTNASGDPVPGKTITSTYAMSDATTDANGDYALKVWPSPDQKVATYWTETYRNAWYSSSGTVELQVDATSVSVGLSDVSGIDLVLTTWPKVSGHVTDANGDPVAFTPVSFYQPYDHFDTATDANGAYTGYLRGGQGGWQAMFGFASVQSEWILQTIIVDSSGDSVRDIVLHRRPVVSGQVLDPHGAPVAGLVVRVTSDAYYLNEQTDTTDASGLFEIRWHFDADPSVRVSYGDWAGTYVPGFLSEDGFVRWDSGQPATTFTLAPDEQLDASVTIPAYVHLTGHVTFADGSPAAGAWVNSQVVGGATGSGVTADGDGAFSLTVAPGSYSLIVPGGFYGAEGFAYRSGAIEPLVVGDEDRDVDVVLPDGHTLSGKVTAGPGPLANGEVDIYLDGWPAASTTTAVDGTWSIVLPPGAYTVGLYDPSRVYAHGWIGATGFTADPDAARVFGLGLVDASTGTVALPSTRKVSGKVVSAVYSNSPVQYAYVEAFVNGVFYASQYANSSGAFSLAVAPGKVTLWVYDAYTFNNAPGWRTATSLSANYANAAAITVSSSSVSGIVIKTPESVYINWNAIEDGSIEAIYNGAATSFAVDDGSGHSLMPLLKGSYRFWVESNLSENPYNQMPDGWYKAPTLVADVALATVRSVTTSANLTVSIPTSGVVGGATRDAFGSLIPNIDVLLYANGHFYTDDVSSGGFGLNVLPGTYRLAFVDLFGEYLTGWLGNDGYVSSFADARDVTVTAGGYADVDIALPEGTPPAPPTNVVATPYHESVGVSFTPPTTTLVRPIVHYAVTANPGGRQCIATVTPSCTVTGLTNGTSYTFTATASTIVGSSIASAPSAAAVPLPVPGAPTSVVATPTTSTIDLSWSAPADHGSAITGYTATLSPGGLSCQTASGDPLACSISGVPDGKYVASVRATNGLGDGPAGTASAIVDTTGPTVTAPVSVLRSGLSMSGTSVPVSVTWTNADPLTGISDTSLQLQVGAGSFVDQTLASPTSVNLLRNLSASSSAYRFRALAADGNGNVSGWATGPSTYVGLKQQSGSGTGTAYSGTWTTSTTSTALGGSLRTTTAKGAYVTFTYTGRGFALVSRKTSTSGQAKIYVDGAYVATIDLRSSTTVSRWIAYARTSTTSAKHVVKIVNSATSGRPRIWIDAFLTIR